MNPEVAADFSGGGFSNYFSRPSYQDAAVLPYLTKLGGQYSGLFKCVLSASTTGSHLADVYMLC